MCIRDSYYPVFAVLFIDFGLTVGQFAVLNAVWAGAIVLCEVPSGALADALGRRALLVASGAIMVIEIALLCFVPLGDPRLVFAAFLLNRLLKMCIRDRMNLDGTVQKVS